MSRLIPSLPPPPSRYDAGAFARILRVLTDAINRMYESNRSDKGRQEADTRRVVQEVIRGGVDNHGLRWRLLESGAYVLVDALSWRPSSGNAYVENYAVKGAGVDSASAWQTVHSDSTQPASFTQTVSNGSVSRYFSLNTDSDGGFQVGAPAQLLYQELSAEMTAPGGLAGFFTRYTDDQSTPKGYVGTSGPVGIPITWYTLHTPVSVTTTASATTLLNTGKGTLTLPAGHLVQGSTFRLRAWGVYSSDGTVTSATFRINLGGTTLKSWTLTHASVTDRPWRVEADIVVASVSGTTASVRLQGFRFDNETYDELSTAATVSVSGIDGTRAWDLTVQPSSGDPDTTHTCTNATIEQLY